MEKKNYDSVITIRTEKELKTSAKIAAVQDGKTLQDYINELIADDIKKREQKEGK